MIQELWQLRKEVREKRPLVYNITNIVAAPWIANVLLASGASPIMSEGAAEAEDLSRICNALVLNIGTLHTQQISQMQKAGECANRAGIPVVFDPVGAGATAYRNMTSWQLLRDVRIALIRGNYSEIAFLAGLGSGDTQGVDSGRKGLSAADLAPFALQQQAVVVATGPVDYIAVPGAAEVLENRTGSPLLQTVTGTGCALSALMGAFLPVAEDPGQAALAAAAFYGAAAEKAAKKSKGPGSFAVRFLDALHSLGEKEFCRIAEKQIGQPALVEEEDEAELLELLLEADKREE